MLFSEKLAQIPQPQRAALWKEYRTLTTAAALKIRIQKEDRLPTEEELNPLRQSARDANGILSAFGFLPSFFPEEDRFFELLTEELDRIKKASNEKDEQS